MAEDNRPYSSACGGCYNSNDCGTHCSECRDCPWDCDHIECEEQDEKYDEEERREGEELERRRKIRARIKILKSLRYLNEYDYEQKKGDDRERKEMMRKYEESRKEEKEREKKEDEGPKRPITEYLEELHMHFIGFPEPSRGPMLAAVEGVVRDVLPRRPNMTQGLVNDILIDAYCKHIPDVTTRGDLLDTLSDIFVRSSKKYNSEGDKLQLCHDRYRNESYMLYRVNAPGDVIQPFPYF